MTILRNKEEMKIRVKNETYFRTYQKNTKFDVLSFTDEKPRALQARIMLPDGKTTFVSLYENSSLGNYTPRFFLENTKEQ